jgi:hypothetical protein
MSLPLASSAATNYSTAKSGRPSRASMSALALSERGATKRRGGRLELQGVLRFHSSCCRPVRFAAEESGSIEDPYARPQTIDYTSASLSAGRFVFCQRRGSSSRLRRSIHHKSCRHADRDKRDNQKSGWSKSRDRSSRPRRPHGPWTHRGGFLNGVPHYRRRRARGVHRLAGPVSAVVGKHFLIDHRTRLGGDCSSKGPGCRIRFRGPPGDASSVQCWRAPCDRKSF